MDGGVEIGTPDGPKLHSVLVDPRDRRHLYFAMSSGGVFESHDRGATWQPRVKGLKSSRDPLSSVYVHDPHCVRYCPSNPDRLYQQNHCGIYRLDRPGKDWIRVGRNMPKKVGDVGFPLVVHPRNDKVAGCFPWMAVVSGRAPARTASLRLTSEERRRKMAAPGQGPPEEGCLVDRQAPGDVW